MPWLNIGMTYWASCSFWNTWQQNQKQIWHKINKFIFKTLHALKAFSFPAKKSLMETFRDIKNHSLMQLQITSHSLLCVRIQCAVIWVTTKRSSETTPRFRNVNNPKPDFFISYQRKFCSCATSWMFDLLSLPLITDRYLSQLFSWDNNAPRFPSGAAHLLLLSF